MIITIDEYIGSQPEKSHEKLNEIRKIIAKAAPDAIERISWEMPTFYLGGNLVHFAAQKNHIGFYPGASGAEFFRTLTHEFETTKGGVQLPYDKPLPREFIEKTVLFRVSENTAASVKFDFKKVYRDLYMPKAEPEALDVPEMCFAALDGKGDPDGDEYANAVSALYSLSYTIKMSKAKPKGYFDYVVPPLEGLWWSSGKFDINKRGDWLWTAMIRQPDFVTDEIFEAAVNEASAKKETPDFSGMRFMRLTEGLCVQALHTGAFSEEPATVENIHLYCSRNGLKVETGEIRKHHEIYLSDPRKTAPDKLRTVLRIPVSK